MRELILACLVAAGGGYVGGVLFADPERSWWAVRDAAERYVFAPVATAVRRLTSPS
jgi:hypothetical protein